MQLITRRLAAMLAASLLLAPPAAGAQSNLNKGGAWSAKTHKCVDTTVTSVGYRLQGMSDSGSAVEFATSLGVSGMKSYNGQPMRAGIVSYNTEPVAAREHRGDRVQVCLVSVPKRDQYCNPSTDSRGRMYRVYDYRQHAAYSGANSEHACGGA